MHKVLEKIIKTTKEDLKQRKQKIPIEKLYQNLLKQQGRSLSHSFLTKIDAIGMLRLGIIAEIKLASPSAGLLSEDHDIGKRAMGYKKAGANAISVVTEKSFFNGNLSFIEEIKEATPDMPILHKDFVIDPYQIYESKSLGANALLLIARILPEDHLKAFVDICLEIGLDPVVEVNSRADLEKAVKTNTQIIAVNARDLDSFEISLENAAKLLKSIPPTFIKLGFSGVNSKDEAKLYRLCGASAILIGTKLMQTEDIKRFIKELTND